MMIIVITGRSCAKQQGNSKWN